MKSDKNLKKNIIKEYNHLKIEKKWQKDWSSKKIYKTVNNSKKKKYYVLDMFPYPSGDGLHVGHPKGYIATDIISRMKRMEGFNVLHPMGFDAFGLPAENYAIKMKINPNIGVSKNVARFKKQLEIIGLDYDWSREINTTDPKYYKWTQWIFLKLLEKGLAYESYEPINWCPSCKTGLANEDLEDGKCERCGSDIELKPMRQWVLRITDYAERLLKDLDQLDWPESIKESQRNWIGKSEGSEIEFKIISVSDVGRPENLDVQHSNAIKVFTTRADTIFGATYLVLAPEHELVKKLKSKISNWEDVESYIDKVKNKTNIERTAEGREKMGVELKNVSVINPANGEKIPVWVADYVLASYGTGAVMAVPAHDKRDFEFAKKYQLPIKQVIAPFFHKNKDNNDKDAVREDKKTVIRKTIYALVFDRKNDRFLCLDWEKFGWHSGIIGGVDDNENHIDAALREIKEETGYKNLKYLKDLGGEQHNNFFAAHKDENRYAIGRGMLFELLDEEKNEIEEENSKNHKLIWIKSEDMSKWLNLSSFEHMWNVYVTDLDCYTEDGILINSGKFNGMSSKEACKEITKFVGGKIVTKYKLRDWVFSRQRYWGEPIPVFHDEEEIIPVKEKDLPVVLPKVKFYEPTGTGESPLAGISKWVNIKVGSGNNFKILKRETNTMPQWAGSSWYYLRYMDPDNDKSLVDKRKEKYWNQVDFYVGGAEHATRHLIYARFWHKFLYDIGVVSTKEPFKKLQSVGLIMGEDGSKMSKRFGNVVNPDNIIINYGADTLRIYEMFMGPFDQAVSWSTESIIGPRRFLERIWKISFRIMEKDDKKTNENLEKILHKTIKKVSEDIENMSFNTAVSSMMMLLNEIDKQTSRDDEQVLTKEDFKKFIQILAPFAPHITEELWFMLGEKKTIHLSRWPKWDKNKIIDEKIKIAIQINGKVRGEILIDKDSKEENVKKDVLLKDNIKNWIDGKEIKKFIYIPNKIINIVT